MAFSIGGTIDENGKLTVFNPDYLKKWISGNKSKVIELTIKVKKDKRSNPLNAYYWGVVVSMVSTRLIDLGNEDMDEDETHDFLKQKFNGKEIVGLGDNWIERPGSTTKLDNFEFIEYLDKIKRFAMEMLDIYIPEPNEQLNIDL